MGETEDETASEGADDVGISASKRGCSPTRPSRQWGKMPKLSPLYRFLLGCCGIL